jgi:hypothetical protein
VHTAAAPVENRPAVQFAHVSSVVAPVALE